MKTKDLIRVLQTVDPVGNCDVVINNVDIGDIYVLSGAENGWYQQIDDPRDPYGRFNSVTKASVIGKGTKLVISPFSLASALKSYPNLKVSILGDDRNGYYKQVVESWRHDSSANKPAYAIPAPAEVDVAIAPNVEMPDLEWADIDDDDDE